MADQETCPHMGEYETGRCGSCEANDRLNTELEYVAAENARLRAEVERLTRERDEARERIGDRLVREVCSEVAFEERAEKAEAALATEREARQRAEAQVAGLAAALRGAIETWAHQDCASGDVEPPCFACAPMLAALTDAAPVLAARIEAAVAPVRERLDAERRTRHDVERWYGESQQSLATMREERDALAAALKHAAEALRPMRDDTGHEGDEESGEHDPDCRQCVIDAAAAHADAALEGSRDNPQAIAIAAALSEALRFFGKGATPWEHEQGEPVNIGSMRAALAGSRAALDARLAEARREALEEAEGACERVRDHAQRVAGSVIRKLAAGDCIDAIRALTPPAKEADRAE